MVLCNIIWPKFTITLLLRKNRVFISKASATENCKFLFSPPPKQRKKTPPVVKIPSFLMEGKDYKGVRQQKLTCESLAICLGKGPCHYSRTQNNYVCKDSRSLQ